MKDGIIQEKVMQTDWLEDRIAAAAPGLEIGQLRAMRDLILHVVKTPIMPSPPESLESARRWSIGCVLRSAGIRDHELATGIFSALMERDWQIEG